MIELYTADWCMACKGLKQRLKQLDVEVVEVNIDKETDKARELGVRGIPLLFNTETQEKLLGNVSVDQIKKFIK